MSFSTLWLHFSKNFPGGAFPRTPALKDLGFAQADFGTLEDKKNVSFYKLSLVVHTGGRTSFFFLIFFIYKIQTPVTRGWILECAGGGATCTQPTCGLGVVAQAVHQKKQRIQGWREGRDKGNNRQQRPVAFCWEGTTLAKKIETTARTWHRHVICRACTRLCLACVPVSIFLARVVVGEPPVETAPYTIRWQFVKDTGMGHLVKGTSDINCKNSDCSSGVDGS